MNSRSQTKQHPAAYTSALPTCGTWLCYILCCADGTLYTGITNDMARRLAAHDAGTAARYTRGRGPVRLVFAEACAGKSAALKREISIKRLPRSGKLALIASVQSGKMAVLADASGRKPVKCASLQLPEPPHAHLWLQHNARERA